MSAFKTLLFPTLVPAEIKRLNHLSSIKLSTHSIDIASELTRALAIANPLSSTDGYQLQYAGDLIEVFCNTQRFNDELSTTQGQSLWGKRTIKYFVYDAQSGLFAPSKFCAYINAIPTIAPTFSAHQQLMSMSLYTSLDESEPKFDGNLAQTHLRRQLNMRLTTPQESPASAEAFTT